MRLKRHKKYTYDAQKNLAIIAINFLDVKGTTYERLDELGFSLNEAELFKVEQDLIENYTESEYAVKRDELRKIDAFEKHYHDITDFICANTEVRYIEKKKLWPVDEIPWDEVKTINFKCTPLHVGKKTRVRVSYRISFPFSLHGWILEHRRDLNATHVHI